MITCDWNPCPGYAELKILTTDGVPFHFCGKHLIEYLKLQEIDKAFAVSLMEGE